MTSVRTERDTIDYVLSLAMTIVAVAAVLSVLVWLAVGWMDP
jgi:hypothetical protein